MIFTYTIISSDISGTDNIRNVKLASMFLGDIP